MTEFESGLRVPIVIHSRIHQHTKTVMPLLKAERKRIARRFWDVFDGLPMDKVANRLACSERQLIRIQSGDTVPNTDIAERMRALLDETRTEAVLTEEERLERDERRRAENEKRQRRISIHHVPRTEEIPIPQWYERVRVLITKHQMEDQNPEILRTCFDLLTDRVNDPSDFANIPERTQPYVLGSYGIVTYYLGMLKESHDAFERCIKVARRTRNDMPSTFLANYTATTGCVLMRLKRFAEAHGAFIDAITIDSADKTACYNGLCAASLNRDEQYVGYWIGRLVEQAKSQLANGAWSIADVQDFLERGTSDPDLDAVRDWPIFKDDLILSLTKIMASHGRGNDTK